MEKMKSLGLRYLVIGHYLDFAKLFLRIIFGGMMLIHGMDKMLSFSVLKLSFPPSIGLSSEWSLVMIILVEVGCSLLVLLGLLTRLAVLPLMFAMIIAAFFTFSPVTIGVVELPMLYFTGFFFLFLAGPGRYSIDNWMVNRYYNAQAKL